MKRAGVLATCLFAAMLWRAAPAAAQTEPRVLMLDDPQRVFQNYWVGVQSVVRIERRTESFPDFLDALRGGGWDYVVFIWYRPRSREEHIELAGLLEEHISRGGTLSFTYPHLDEAPELWEVLGVASAEDPAAPEFIWPAAMWHPTWLGAGRLVIDAPPRWSDFGDVLTAAPGGRVIAEYEVSRLPVMLETRRGHVIVNGLNWDDWEPASGMGRAQTRFLTLCIPDFDDNGVLDFFDFLAFQDAFAAKDPRADLARDGVFDLFDFLAFQDVFAYGCPRE